MVEASPDKGAVMDHGFIAGIFIVVIVVLGAVLLVVSRARAARVETDRGVIDCAVRSIGTRRWKSGAARLQRRFISFTPYQGGFRFLHGNELQISVDGSNSHYVDGSNSHYEVPGSLDTLILGSGYRIITLNTSVGRLELAARVSSLSLLNDITLS